MRRTQFVFLWLGLAILLIAAVSTLGRAVSPRVALPMYLGAIAGAAFLLRYFMAPQASKERPKGDKNRHMKS